MPKIFIVDIETTGLDVKTVDIHCVVIQIRGEEAEAFRPHETPAAIARLNELLADGFILSGHNVIRYDIPILVRFGMNEPEVGRVYDTVMVSRAAYPGNKLGALDKGYLMKHPGLRGDLHVGAHSLKAWGLRLGCPKDMYDGGWETFSEEMFTYCIQDVNSNWTLAEKLLDRMPFEAAMMECEVARICNRMTDHGFAFDRKAAEELVITLTTRRAELTNELRILYAPWYKPVKAGVVETPKRSAVSRLIDPGEVGYRNVKKNCQFTKVEQVSFNPASTQHIADRLMTVHGWKPTHYTPGGQPMMSGDILRDLPYPEAPLLAEYQELKKILAYLSEGQNAWLKLEQAGRLHGTVNPTGTVTSRAAHARPNLGNVPSRSDLGKACRTLFVASTGKVMVGADAAGLQLRGLAHYLGRWDGGEYARQIVSGDIHSFNQKAVGLYFRDSAKTFIYALLFGAGEAKLGATVLADLHRAKEEGLYSGELPGNKACRRLGKTARRNLGDAIPAFDKLADVLKDSAAAGSLKALDGREIPIASDHVGLAMLLQSFEACVMKYAMVGSDMVLPESADIVGWIHDEFQTECLPEDADATGQAMTCAMAAAGIHYKLRVPIAGEYKVGSSWSDTH